MRIKSPGTLLSVAIATLGPFTFGLSLGYSGQTEGTMSNQLYSHKKRVPVPEVLAVLDGAYRDLFGTLVTLGALVGSLLAGPISNRYGRKLIICLASPLFSLSWLWIALANTGIELVVARFVVGIAVGFVSFGIPTYIAEISPIDLRGSLGSVNQLAITFGILFAYILGWIIRTDGGQGEKFSGVFCDWRTVAFIYMVPSILLGLFILVPESPRYLASKGRLDEAKICLLKLRGVTSESSLSDPLEIPSLETLSIASKSAPPQSLINIPALAKCKWQLFIAIILMLFQQCSGINAVIFFQTSIFDAAKLANQETMAITVMAVQFIVTAIFVFVMDKVGRTVLLIFGSLGMSTAAMILGVSLTLTAKEPASDTTTVYGYLALIGAYLYISAFSIGVGAIPWILLSELFPDEARSSAASIATAHNWLFGFLVTYTVKFLDHELDLSQGGLEYVFWFFMLVCAGLSVFTSLFIPETKGRTFDEIQEEFKIKNSKSSMPITRE